MKNLIRNLVLCSCSLGLLACARSYEPQSYLTGQIRLAPPQNYPPDKLHIQARLVELDAKNEVHSLVAEQYINKPSTTPIGFSLCYDQSAIKAGSIYAVEASLYLDGELTMQTTSPQPLTIPFPAGVQIEIKPTNQP